jgi:hypothetical protein
MKAPGRNRAAGAKRKNKYSKKTLSDACCIFALFNIEIIL